MKQWVTLAAAGLAALSTTLHAAEYGSITDDQFNQIVEEVRRDPTLFSLHKRNDLPRKATTQQIDTLVQKMDLNEYTWIYPAVVHGEQIPALLGQDIGSISVMAVRAGKLIPIPFQIDQKDVDNQIYVEGVSGKINGTVGKLSPKDELVFMYRDTGTERYDAQKTPLASGKLAGELSFDFQGKRRYAYVITGSSARSDAQYVSFKELPKTYRMQTNFYNFETSKDNFLIFKDFRANAGPTPQHRVLDALIAEISTGVITSWPRINVDIRNLRTEFVGIRQGPVRDIIKLKILVVVAGIPVFRIYTDMTVYDQGLYLPIKLHIPGGEILTRVLNKPKIVIALDLNNLMGARGTASVNPTGQYAKVDGKTTDAERQLDVHLPDNVWLWMESARGWDLVLQADMPHDWPVEGRGFYEDSLKPEKTYAWEDFPGALPRFGFIVNKLPVGRLDIDITAVLWFPATVGAAGPEKFVQMMRTPPQLSINQI